MYTIQIYYTTGNSFGSKEETDDIGYSFETKEEARIVLSYIKEHYKMYKELNEWQPYTQRNNKAITREAILNRYKDKIWFYSQYPDQAIKYLDRNISCFWTGYFETLHTATIILENKDSDEDCFHA